MKDFITTIVQSTSKWMIGVFFGIVTGTWGIAKTIEAEKKEFKEEILEHVSEWRESDMQIVKDIKKDTRDIKKILMQRNR